MKRKKDELMSQKELDEGLYSAAVWGAEDAIIEYLDKGGNPNYVKRNLYLTAGEEGNDAVTPNALQHIVFWRMNRLPEIICKMIDSKVDVNAKGPKNQTAMMVFCSQCNGETLTSVERAAATVLLRGNVEMDIPHEDGRKAIDFIKHPSARAEMVALIDKVASSKEIDATCIQKGKRIEPKEEKTFQNEG